MNILNLTQHAGTPDQGVIEPKNKAAIQAALTFETLPTMADIRDRASVIAGLVAQESIDQGVDFDAAMIGGAPFLMASLEDALKNDGVTPLYAFSVRQSSDTVLPDGTVKKTAVFRHGGIINAR